MGQSISPQILQNIEEIRKKNAPDKRTAMFLVETALENGQIRWKVETDQAQAKTDLLAKFSDLGLKESDIKMLPDSDLGEFTQGVIKVSVANLRSEPKHSAEMATQSILGTPIKVLKKQNGWYLIQTPDLYISWVENKEIQLFNKIQAQDWTSSPKIIYLNPYGFTYQNPDRNSQTVSDLVLGNVLKFAGDKDEYTKVVYPDGRIAYIFRDESIILPFWFLTIQASPKNLSASAKRLMGVPYLWGGTSFKGVDCSGFTKTVYFLNGLLIPRDASQQVHEGELVDTDKNFGKLEVGDLLFFGEKATTESAEKIIHVGIWLGNNEFIHASGMVRVSSVDKSAPNFDEYELNRYLRTKRLLNTQSKGVKNLKEVFGN